MFCTMPAAALADAFLRARGTLEAAGSGHELHLVGLLLLVGARRRVSWGLGDDVQLPADGSVHERHARDLRALLGLFQHGPTDDGRCLALLEDLHLDIPVAFGHREARERQAFEFVFHRARQADILRASPDLLHRPLIVVPTVTVRRGHQVHGAGDTGDGADVSWLQGATPSIGDVLVPLRQLHLRALLQLLGLLLLIVVFDDIVLLVPLHPFLAGRSQRAADGLASDVPGPPAACRFVLGGTGRQLP
mmetsp:Transcript_22378/g.76652  ORF Transcript_22378/g.76652 Transcript_22378/m.76652 type:complete len:248 (-) Transcript_22378:1533-2276(-)